MRNLITVFAVTLLVACHSPATPSPTRDQELNLSFTQAPASVVEARNLLTQGHVLVERDWLPTPDLPQPVWTVTFTVAWDGPAEQTAVVIDESHIVHADGPSEIRFTRTHARGYPAEVYHASEIIRMTVPQVWVKVGEQAEQVWFYQEQSL